jgi:hypothetical protein
MEHPMNLYNEDDLQRYEHDLVIVLDILKRVDISQLLTDIRANNPKTYNAIVQYIQKDYFYASH